MNVPDFAFQNLPTVDVEYSEEDPRRKSKRRRGPAVLHWFDDMDRVRIVRLEVSGVRPETPGSRCARLADCSREGAHIVTDHEFAVGSEIRVNGICAETGEILFRNGFRVCRRRTCRSELETAGASAEFTFGSIVDQSLEQHARRLEHYGLEFRPTGIPDTQSRNMVLQTFRDSALLRHHRRRKQP